MPPSSRPTLSAPARNLDGLQTVLRAQRGGPRYNPWQDPPESPLVFVDDPTPEPAGAHTQNPAPLVQPPTITRLFASWKSTRRHQWRGIRTPRGHRIWY